LVAISATRPFERSAVATADWRIIIVQYQPDFRLVTKVLRSSAHQRALRGDLKFCRSPPDNKLP